LSGELAGPHENKRILFLLKRVVAPATIAPKQGGGFNDKWVEIFRQKMKRRTSSPKRRKKEKDSETGIKKGFDRFFLGGESKIAGFMHIKPPRWAEEYQQMGIGDLVQRIQDDLEELLARAYPSYTEERNQRFAPNYWRKFPITHEGYLRCVVNKTVAEELCHGLWNRIISPDETTSRKAAKEYQRLLQQFLKEEPKRAANALAFLAQQAATYLEHVFAKRASVIREIAAKYDLWPVNLGLRAKMVKGKPVYQVTRQAFARDYLIQLGLNSRCDFHSSHVSGAQSISPFRLAAEELYITMLQLKDGRWNCFSKITPWARRLFALTAPMTKANSTEWWTVAKDYLYERWKKAQKEFKPLIEHLGLPYPIKLSSKTPYESNIKSRVIDNSLKDAFTALARPDL
jgi:hypothetical protein